MIEKIVIVIILYKTKLEDSLSFQSLKASSNNLPNTLSLYIYDNSPDEFFEVIDYDCFDIFYEKDYLNSGISKAYNKAAKYAENKGKEWLLLLDQDSSLPIDFLSSLEYSVLQYPNQSVFAPKLKHDLVLLSPCRFKNMKGSSFTDIKPGVNSFVNTSIFNSGILVRLSVFLEIGGYNEKVPLDFSDHSFIHRLKRKNKEFVVMPIEIAHQLSSFSGNYTVILKRFVQYCDGVINYHLFEEKSNLLLFWTFLRAIKLTVQFKDFVFFKTMYKCFSSVN